MSKAFRMIVLLIAGILLATGILLADRQPVQTPVALSSTRTHFTIEEPVELMVHMLTPAPLEIRHADGSLLSLEVPAPGGPVTVQPRTLKPGYYTARVGEHAVSFTIHPAEHKNAYFTGQWVTHGGTIPAALAKGGWMYMPSDLAPLHSRRSRPGDLAEGYVQARMKPFAVTILGGGFQMDIDKANDWGDPWVQRAAIWRMNLGALTNRIYPIAGLHAYDEPLLTRWYEDNPFAVPHQVEEFEKLAGVKMPAGPLKETITKYAPMMDNWLAFNDMRMKYLEQSGHAVVWGTDAVAPHFATINQTSNSYLPGFVTEGVDGRMNRPYHIISGHGGYSHSLPGTILPLRSAEGSRSCSWEKPLYYLPMWCTHTWATMRNAVWASWTTKLEGMLYTPEHDFELNGDHYGFDGTHGVFEIADINRKLAMVGGVMNRLPKTLSPVAVLHSDRQDAHDIAVDNYPAVRKVGAPQVDNSHSVAVDACFFRCVDAGVVPNWIDEVEAAEKGARFLKQWKVIFCPGLSTATPAFRKALEEYIAGGGKLIQFKGDKLQLKDAVIADHSYRNGSEYWLEHPRAIDNYNHSDRVFLQWLNNFAPTFARDLADWIGLQPYGVENIDVILGTHTAGRAAYLLMANNVQDAANPRGVRHELIPVETHVRLPKGGVVYDLFHGGRVPVTNGRAPLALAAGDGACWLHLPQAPGKMRLQVKAVKDDPGVALQIRLAWGKEGFLPFRLRVYDPAGNEVDDLYHATARGVFEKRYPLGANATPGKWTVEVSEWMTGQTVRAAAGVKPPMTSRCSSLAEGDVSIYFDDARRITDLFAGKPLEPDYAKLNWDAKRVLGLDPKKFAVFGEEKVAEQVAAALRAKGMTVQVNPPYATEPFMREPDRGGSGPVFREQNYENIYAHSIVLSSHPLAEQSWNRGHLNRQVTDAFPGAGRAYVQWGISCYQAGWQNVFVLGDMEAGVRWLLAAMAGKATVPVRPVTGRVTPAHAVKAPIPPALAVAQEIKLNDTPVGVAAGRNGVTYVALYGGTIAAYDAAGKALWHTRPLIFAEDMELSPRGDRLAVAGYPGLLILNAADGKVIGGYRHPPTPGSLWPAQANRMIDVTWNSTGTLAAACWANSSTDNTAYFGYEVTPPRPVVVLNADGTPCSSPLIESKIMGVAFVPGTDNLLIGAEKLTAVDARTGKTLWSNDVKYARAFAFSPEGRTGAAGGWGRTVARFDPADGRILQQAAFDSVIGGIALLPSGTLAAAVWGGTHPLYILRPGSEKPEALFQSRFGFQDVRWTPAGLLAAEQGGPLWLLAADGRPIRMLDEESGTTAYRLQVTGDRVLVGRMNRVVQRVNLQ
ncbi:MAG: WD40 repeat domain-containing protein [Armatimonadota bacterium]